MRKSFRRAAFSWLRSLTSPSRLIVLHQSRYGALRLGSAGDDHVLAAACYNYHRVVGFNR